MLVADGRHRLSFSQLFEHGAVGNRSPSVTREITSKHEEIPQKTRHPKAQQSEDLSISTEICAGL